MIVPNRSVVAKISGSASRDKLDRLGVAAALEIEDALGAPAVLVVADQGARRIGRKRRLAGARQAEEQRRIARWPRYWPSNASA